MTIKPQVSAVLVLNGKLPYPKSAFKNCIKSILNQELVTSEVIIADGTGKGEGEKIAKSLPKALQGSVKVAKGKFKNRAKAFNAGLKKAAGDFIIVTDTQDDPTVF